jgi:two-component system, OmpR family, response regulator ResD
MGRAHRVLVVDDEPIVADVLTRYLTREGFEVATAHDGQEAVESFPSFCPDLVLLDLMLPRLDGLEVFRRIRDEAAVPVIMLTARGEETDRVVGLELGADDYVTKPFSPREIVARVRAVLRRADRRRGDAGTVSVGTLEIDGRSREVRKAGAAVRLTPKEFDLLHLLASHPGQVFTRLDLLEELWDFAFDGDPSTVTVHVRRLREKIEDDPSAPRHLITVWGVGYRLDP